MPRLQRVVLLLCLITCIAYGDQDLGETECPICNMIVNPELKQDIKGNQAVYACDMAGHLEQLVETPTMILRGTHPINKLPIPYKNAEVACPICGSKSIGYEIVWGRLGNQKIFSDSLDHANMILSNPKSYFIKPQPNDTNDFCTGASTMFDGFQSSIHHTCTKLLFQPWVLNSSVKYAFGFIGVVLLGVAIEGLVEFQEYVHKSLMNIYGLTQVITEDYVAMTSANCSLMSMLQTPTYSRCLPFWCKCVLALIYVITLASAYFLMLIVMTYETGFFIAAVMGLGIGFFLFKDVECGTMKGNIDPCCST